MTRAQTSKPMAHPHLQMPYPHPCPCHQIHPPTGVTHAVAGAFTRTAGVDGALPDVVVACSTRLQLWRARCAADEHSAHLHACMHATTTESG
jgi:hypothetical protein